MRLYDIFHTKYYMVVMKVENDKAYQILVRPILYANILAMQRNEKNSPLPELSLQGKII